MNSLFKLNLFCFSFKRTQVFRVQFPTHIIEKPIISRRNYIFTLFFFFLLPLSIFQIHAQGKLSGTVQDLRGTPLAGAHISLEPSNLKTITNTDGAFEIIEIPSGDYTLSVTHLGFTRYEEQILISSTELSVSIVLTDDPLLLQTVVVTGTFEPRSLKESSTSVSILGPKSIGEFFPRGTSELLRSIPGTFVDAAAGEVFTKVYSRGISASAEDDIGWYYISLQEDGLPISLIQHSYYTPDLFHRTDLTIEQVEGIRGGSSAITAMNAPGGIYNFKSFGARNKFGGEVSLQYGLQGDNNPFTKVDLSLGGSLGNSWYYNVGGHFRRDDGARNVDFTFSEGGQLKFNFIKTNENGYFKISGKILDDLTNRWHGVAATNWDGPEAAFGQDFQNTALLMPAFESYIPDGRDLDENDVNRFDPGRGVRAQDLAIAADIDQNLGNGWSFRLNSRLSAKRANWQTSISNTLVSLNNPLAYFISGADFPIGQVVFRDAPSGNEIARINNAGILSGDSFEYLTTGSLPNDAIMGTSAWFKDIEADELISQLNFRKQWKNNDLSIGSSLGLSNSSLFTQGSFAYVTYEPNPRMMQVTLENPGFPTIALSDENGVSNYGGLFFINARAKVRQFSLFANDRWTINPKVQFDLGFRFESISHDGSNDRFAPASLDGGFDGNNDTAYDNGILAPTGERDAFDYNYSYLSYSTGINYSASESLSVFARYSRGNKAPELDYYFNNFSNVPINQKGEVQKIIQAELGVKLSTKEFSFTGTTFWSRLKNIGVSNFEFDNSDNTVFYTPVQFNTSTTFGFEWESAYSPVKNITLTFDGSVMDSKATKWTIYNAQGTVDTDDDTITDYSDNNLPFSPNLMFNIGGEYQSRKFGAYLRCFWMGEREGNVANAFQLPSYAIFNGGISFDFSNRISAQLLVTNIFNSEGLVNFFGGNSFGANANGVTADFINNNPNASFVVVPTLPRGTLLKLNYRL